ncbi:PLC-like phosphodiesterase [Jimgerdemannia flammicorona]|uniref:PLC-like phosphodiesterase n=1 Tax=Jimgerdemannia flammicorona TaxID=994334 RepID=A0A433Q288_9FUNG|nr:PLC-like phosphodiesterase [Jimgerdemannia flammicorona]
MHLRTTLPLVFLASLACLHPTAAAATTTQACNGDATFCVRKYSQVTYVTTHNSYAYQSGNVAANQRYDIVTQLNDGVRGFMLDAHYKLDTNPNGIQLCHASCSLLDSGDLLTTLQQMNQWLLVNPTEVVTIFWENFDNIPAATFNTAYLQSGIMNIVYTQPAATLDWPTLGDLVKQNKRVINFIDRGADAAVPW